MYHQGERSNIIINLLEKLTVLYVYFQIYTITKCESLICQVLIRNLIDPVMQLI